MRLADLPSRVWGWCFGLVDSLRIFRNLRAHIDHQRMLMAEPAVRDIRSTPQATSIAELELSVFSQWGDDGIIQWLEAQLPQVPRTFIEVGVEDYIESTTRYLLMRCNWSGLIVDSSNTFVKRIRRSHYYWRHELQAKQALVTAESVNKLFSDAGFSGDIGLLHIDVDGMDYWIWKAVECVRPAVVIAEYNAVFGSKRAITVPYAADFSRTQAHHSNLYFGASLLALYELAESKGYRFIGCTSSGNNAYFLRSDLLLPEIPTVDVEQGFVESKFRESRDVDGHLDFKTGAGRLQAISGLPVFDTRAEKILPL